MLYPLSQETKDKLNKRMTKIHTELIDIWSSYNYLIPDDNQEKDYTYVKVIFACIMATPLLWLYFTYIVKFYALIFNLIS